MVTSRHEGGFTLIELSIVLVIIGLIVGGILVGRNLIDAAAIRAQVTQIEKYNTAANTFREKYGFLPGDIPQVAVTQFGFTAAPSRQGTLGEGDGNGELDGGIYSYSESGELTWFWVDLSTNSNLIAGGFNSAYGVDGWISSSKNCTSVTACSPYFPAAAINNGAFVYVYSGYVVPCCSSPTTNIGPNFFGLSFINAITNDVISAGGPALTVAQAYALDKKVDDGLPTTGNVMAQYLGNLTNGSQAWSANGSTPSASTCYDTSTGTAAYSIYYQGGSLVNCGISFRMQAGD